MIRVPRCTPAVAAAVVAFAVYLRTLAPGLVAAMDVPKFQLVGRILGVPHQPGYPLYVLISHVFTWLPIGTVAYRVNLMSAVFAAVTVGLAADVLRRLGAPAVIAAGVAVASGLGSVMWNHAVVAEVYSLETALLAGIVWALLRWERTRQEGSFYLAVGLLGLSLGHHTTIVVFVPAMAAFVLLVDRHWLSSSRRLALSALILALGVGQYAFVLVRTAQGAVFNQAPAHNLRELVDVMAGRQFQGALFAFDLQSVVSRRIPLIAGLLRSELGLSGLALAVIGLARLCRHRLPFACLLGGGAAGYAFFTINYDVDDPHVFLIPATLLLWLAAGTGLAWIAESRLARRPAAGVATVLAVVLPVSLYFSNSRACDRSHETSVARYFDALFRQLPARPGFIAEDFVIDHLVLYKVLAEQAAPASILPSRPGAIEEARRSGAAVFGFRRSVSRLRLEGVGFVPLELRPPSLADHLRHLEPGTIALLALPSLRTAPVTGSMGRLLEGLGDHDRVSTRLLLNGVVIGVAGGVGSPDERFDATNASLSLPKGRAIGGTRTKAPVALGATANADETNITVDGHDIIRARGTGGLVVLSSGGSVLERHLLPLGKSLAPVFSRNVPVLFQMNAERDCGLPSSAWTDQTARASNGRLLVRLPKGGQTTLYVAGPREMAPRVLAETERSVTNIDVQDLSAAGIAARGEVVEADGLDVPQLSAVRHLLRVTLRQKAAEHAEVGVVLAFGRVPESVWLGAPPPGSGVVACRDQGTPPVLFSDAGVMTEELGLSNADEDWLGRGWQPRAEGDAAGAFRWFTSEGVLLLNMAGAAERLWLDVLVPAEEGATRIAVVINGIELPGHSVSPGWAHYEWETPTSTWRAGTNELVIRLQSAPGTGHAPRAAVRWVRLSRGNFAP